MLEWAIYFRKLSDYPNRPPPCELVSSLLYGLDQWESTSKREQGGCKVFTYFVLGIGRKP